MARVQTIVCDRCGKRDTDSPVTPWTGKRAAARVSGDLCDECWHDLLDMFHASAAPRGRHQIVLTDPTKIRK